MSEFLKVPKYFRNMNPFCKYFLQYTAVFSGILWANYSFNQYKVVGNVLFSFFPIIGAVTMYLWLILLADDFVEVLKSHSKIASIIKKVKFFSFIIIALYGLMAIALWVNRISLEPVITKTTKIVSISYAHIGPINYSRITLKAWDKEKGARDVLLTKEDETELYAGEDVEILMRKGILNLYRVLEIRTDMEKYYFKMLKVAPDSNTALSALIKVYAERSDFEKALEMYNSYSETLWNKYDVGYDLGVMLVEGRKYKKAVDVFRKVLGTKKDYEVLYMLGYALAWAGEKYEAEKYLKEAIELDPTDFRALYSLGYVYNDTSRYAEAKEAWTKVLKLMPHFPEVENNIKNIESMAKPK